MIEPTLNLEPVGYKLNPEKLKEAPQKVLPYLFSCFYFKEEFEYFDLVKPYLDIPEEPKTLEEISQELDEKIDALIKTTKEKFECSKKTAEYYYNERFDRIFSNFHYAKEYGYFPEVRFAKIGRIDYDTLSVSNIGSPSFVVKQGNKHDGYYTNGNRRYFKYYMPDKPNMIVRFFMRTCLGFYWVDEKDT